MPGAAVIGRILLHRTLYHALRGRYSLAKGLGALARGEHDEEKRLLKQSFLAAPKGGAPLHADGGWFRAAFAGCFDENRESLHEKHLRLIDGLDDESRGVVSGTVSRLMDLHRMDKMCRLDKGGRRDI
jgi:hypothetical protein